MIRFQKLHERALLPQLATPGSIGLDVHAFCISESGRTNHIIVGPRSTRNIPTGLKIQCPDGYYVQVCSRSGLASQSIFVANAPGIIDPDYRGELQVLLYNGGHESFYVKHEMRIAQLVLATAHEIKLIYEGPIDETETVRGAKGFGSTGL